MLKYFFSRRKIWLNNLNKMDLIDKKLSTDHRVCGKHFSNDMFAKHNLKRTAVPIKINEVMVQEEVLIVEGNK